MANSAMLVATTVFRLIPICAIADAPLTSGDLEIQHLTQKVVASTTAAWAEDFERHGLHYTEPRVLFLNLPAGHPGRGSGYSNLIGLIVDVNDMGGLDRTLGAQSQSVEALIIAHEIGHRVQYLLSAAGARPLRDAGLQRELQADCYSGWWFARHPGISSFNHASMDPELPEFRISMSKALQVLTVLESGRIPLRRDQTSINHGRLDQRLAAITAGFNASDSWQCQ